MSKRQEYIQRGLPQRWPAKDGQPARDCHCRECEEARRMGLGDRRIDLSEEMHRRGLATEDDLQRALEQVKATTMTAVEARIIRDIKTGHAVQVEDMPSHPSEAFLQEMHLITESKAED